MATKAKARKRPVPLDVEPEKKVEKPLHLSTNYTGRLREIGNILDGIILRNIKNGRDLSIAGSITEEEVRYIFLLTRVKRVNGSKHKSR